MSDKIGRNDNCPCGSSKKYKKCCGSAASETFSVMDFQSRKLRQVESDVVNKHLFFYVTKELSPDIIKLAESDFFPKDFPDALDDELLFECFFMPWFLFNWKSCKKENFHSFNSELTVSQNYVTRHASRLNSLERRFIDNMQQTYYSFYSIIDVIPEKSIVVKDIFLETTHTVKERQATYTLKRGDIVFSSILTQDEQSVFIGMAPYPMPASYHLTLIDFKQHLIKANKKKPLTADSLREKHPYEMLDVFFWIINDVYNKPLPSLQNTDGDPLQFCKSYFKISLTPEETLKQVLPLALSKHPEEFLEDAKRDKNGHIKRIELPWLKKGNKRHHHWSNTILGHLVIEQGKLILETNSERRAERGKKLLITSLGDAIVFQKMLIETPAQKLTSSKSSYLTSEHNKLLELPEVQEQLKHLAKAHWDSWLDTPIPALGNKTPRAATKTKIGKEKLEALLLEYECHDSEKTNNLFKADIADLKTKLGLVIPNSA
ncbi:MAG: hypothetical protein LEGION0398_MBIBDBAK_00762 [Legionellaceae bacterium]